MMDEMEGEGELEGMLEWVDDQAVCGGKGGSGADGDSKGEVQISS